ncbi:hypothetical protein Glove_642g4 [Diversispora epigaea]|uniref:Uncharacterized protein n=1 Tax=Diversispora epigaea TaxID=1348612 RepID=A0A397GAF1_9GLOM|nr:hypothetical protein Glove_642g4 [Diversispora epigaea]
MLPSVFSITHSSDFVVWLQPRYNFHNNNKIQNSFDTPTPITISTWGHAVHRTCIEKFVVNKPEPHCPNCGAQDNEFNMGEMEVRPSKKPCEDEKDEK